MNLDHHVPSASKLAKAFRWTGRLGAFALLLNVLAAPAIAGTYDGAMGRTKYVAMTGDVNGDGHNDVLMKAVPKVILIPLDDDLSVPVPIPVPSPTFALISTGYGTYALTVNPSAVILASTAWTAATQQVTFAGASGTVAASVTITAASTSQASFVVAMAADTGALQLTSTTAPAVDNSTSGTGPSSSAVPIPVAITPPFLNNPDAGTLPGELSVSNSGTANYGIAIVVPPGTAGLQPNLSLNYSSNGQNGLLGLGWSLGGLSSIHRCGKTIAQDQVNDRIKFAESDRLCLDGQRLVLVNTAVNDANYWADGAEFRTELESFSRITAIGPITSRSYKVEAKDGRISWYGSTASSTVAAIVGTVNGGGAPQPQQKTGAQSWALAQISDRAGNYIKLNYEQDMAKGEHRPSVVRYGGVGLASHAAVRFEYASRPDTWKRYIDETRNDLRSRISNIKTYVGTNLDGDVAATGALVRDYVLTYEQSPTSGRSLLKAAQACAMHPDTNARECLPETTFTWGKPNKAPGFKSLGFWNGAPELTTHNTTAKFGMQDADHPEYFAFSDFDSNGRVDVLEKRVAPEYHSPKELDDYDTLLRLSSNPNHHGLKLTTYRYFHNTGTGFAQYKYKLNTDESFVVLDVGDFNGDGALDLFVSASATKICLSPLANAASIGAPGSTITFNCQPALSLGSAWGNQSKKRPLIFDALGDGRSAVYSTIDNNGHAAKLIAEKK